MIKVLCWSKCQLLIAVVREQKQQNVDYNVRLLYYAFQKQVNSEVQKSN